MVQSWIFSGILQMFFLSMFCRKSVCTGQTHKSTHLYNIYIIHNTNIYKISIKESVCQHSVINLLICIGPFSKLSCFIWLTRQKLPGHCSVKSMQVQLQELHTNIFSKKKKKTLMHAVYRNIFHHGWLYDRWKSFRSKLAIHKISK